MKKLAFLLSLFCIGFFMVSCGGDDDEIAPVILISAPTDGATFSAGDTTAFSFAVTEDVALQTITISGTLGLSETITTFDSPTNHALNADLIINTATEAGTYDITITAEDDSANESSATVSVNIQ